MLQYVLEVCSLTSQTCLTPAEPTIEHCAVIEIIASQEKPDGRYVTHTVPDLSLRVRYSTLHHCIHTVLFNILCE